MATTIAMTPAIGSMPLAASGPCAALGPWTVGVRSDKSSAGSACCRHVTVNDLGQLAVKNDNAERSVDTVKLMTRVVEDPALQIPDSIDGLEVTLRFSCVVCNQECMLYAAGLPKTVQLYARMSVDE